MKDFGNCKTCLLETGDGQYIQNKGDLPLHEVNLQSKFASEPVFVYIDQPRHLRTGFRKRLFISYQDQGVKKSGFENPNVILHKNRIQ